MFCSIPETVLLFLNWTLSHGIWLYGESLWGMGIEFGNPHGEWGLNVAILTRNGAQLQNPYEDQGCSKKNGVKA